MSDELTDHELQSLRNMGNEAERAADEITHLRAALAAAQPPATVKESLTTGAQPPAAMPAAELEALAREAGLQRDGDNWHSVGPTKYDEYDVSTADLARFAALVLAQAQSVPATGAQPWQPIETAPDDGRRALVYRPLAELSGDQPIAIKRLLGGNADCWPKTVPADSTPTNPTDGACHVTHWMPLPTAPTGSAG